MVWLGHGYATSRNMPVFTVKWGYEVNVPLTKAALKINPTAPR